MATEETGRKKWRLTQETLDNLLGHLSLDRDEAGAKYEKIRQRLLTFFRCNNCVDAGACADETLDRIARRLPEIRELTSFLRGVARKVAAESRDKREHQLGEPDTPPSPSFEDHLAPSLEDQRLERLEICLANLPPKERALITEYYQFDPKEKIAHRKRLAAARGMKMDQLRVEVFRIRTKLKDMMGERPVPPAKK